MLRLIKSLRDWFGVWLACLTISIGGGCSALLEQYRLPTERTEIRSLVLRSDDGSWLHVRLTDDYYRIEPNRGVSRVFQDLLLSYEDRRYWLHPGVDPISIIRAFSENLWSGSVVSGASTITMQVSRLLRPHKRSLAGKINQALGALWLEKHYSKSEILQMYYLIAPYGGNVEGVEMAARYWFGKSSSDLSVAEAAMLVAIPQNPYFHSPALFPDQARSARDRVLRKGYESGLLSLQTYQDATHSPLPSAPKSFPKLSHHLADNLQNENRFGYVDTTIRRELQQTANKLALNWPINDNENLGIVVLDKKGAVKAMVGSQDYLNSERLGAVNYTRSARSPGSTLKPLIYSYAETKGVLRYEEVFLDQPTDFGGYAPENFDRTNGGLTSFGEALIRSDNRAAVEALARVTPEAFGSAMESTGVEWRGAVGLPMAAGGVGISLLDLCHLYTSFQNSGVAHPYRFEGKSAVAGHPLFSPLASERTNDLLSSVALPKGRSLTSIQHSFGLKTGTGPRGSDALAIWYDAEHVVCGWIGTPKNQAAPNNSGLSTTAPLVLAISDSLGSTKAIASKKVGPPVQPSPSTESPLKVVFPADGEKLVLPKGRDSISLVVTGATYPLRIRMNEYAIEVLERPSDKLKFSSGGFWNLEIYDASLRTAKLNLAVSMIE